MKRNLKVAAISEVGQVKRVNQDHILVRIGEVNQEEFGIFAVADGMGGLSAGEYASAYTLQKINKWWQDQVATLLMEREPIKAVSDSLVRLVNQINLEMLEKSREISLKMGTTLSILFLYKNEYYILHIGDSRIYRHESIILDQLTEDHSFVGDLLRKGFITQKEARVHPKRNLLTRCLGISKEINPFQRRGQLKKREGFFLCSDGFYNPIEEKDILITMKKYKRNPQKGLDCLTQLICERGAYDNLSAIYIGVEDRYRIFNL